MPPTRPDRSASSARGFTLIEMVVAIVLTSIIVATTVYFVYPVRQAADLTTRAELTDIADNTLQRIGRDVRLALPNSVRQTSSGSSVFLEFIPVRTAGRYRADAGGASIGTDCPNTGSLGVPASDQLSFELADGCFKTIGTVANADQIVVNSDFLVLNNYGKDFTDQDAYANGAANRVLITSLGSPPGETDRHRFAFAATTFRRVLHDSPGKRFYVVTMPVSYVCDTSAGTLTRYSGYAFTATGLQPTDTTAMGTPARIADNVTACVFDYSPNVAPQVGLLTLRLTLSKTLSGGETETVSLYHAVHVNNVP
jgi:MSHA biogenesis protein MshO